MADLDKVAAESAQVEQALAAAQAVRDRAAAAELDRIVAVATQRITAAISLSRVPHDVHRFVPYPAREGRYPGCVRCPFAPDHPIHVEESK